MRRTYPIRFEQAETFSPDVEWLKNVQILATRYRRTYGVKRVGGNFFLEYSKPGVKYAFKVKP